MEKKIQEILEDLFAIDPSFKEHESKLRTIIQNLVENQPNAKLDQAFVENLKRQLLAKASLMQVDKKINVFNFMTKTNYVLASVVVLAVVIAGGGYYYNKQMTPGNQIASEVAFGDKVEIEKVNSNAFGKLALENTFVRNQSGGGGGGAGNMALPANAGTAVTSESSSQNMAAPLAIGIGGGGGDAMSGKIGIMPVPASQYKFVYKGEELVLDKTEMEVYKRIKGGFGSSAVSSVLRNLNFGLINLNNLSNANVQYINVVEDKDYGYSFSINFEEGVISIYENWTRWQTPDRLCQDEACYEANRLKISDIPSDEEIINIANSFLSEHNIKVSSYGKPKIQDYWKKEYERATDKAQVYIPDVVTVIYPQILNGQTVYDQSGNETGLMVSVNVRVKKGSGISELSSLKYQSSMYPTITDVKKVLEIASRGGMYQYYPFYEGATVKELELGAPKLSLIKHWQYKDNQNTELLIPALIFPILNAPSDQYFYQNNVVVPLVEEILNEQTPYPMPLMEDAVK